MSTSELDRNPAMTSAEFRLLRERLGLPVSWLATHLRVEGREEPGFDLRTVQRWDQGDLRISERVAAAMRDLKAEQQRFVDEVLASLRMDVDEDPTEPMWVVTHPSDRAYRAAWADASYPAVYPASWHRAAMYEVADRDHRVRVRYLSEASE